MTKFSIQKISREFRFVSKAGTLASLKSQIKLSKLCEQETIQTSDWQAHCGQIVKTIVNRFGALKLAVRSSAASEDGWNSSQAGVHLSLINVIATPLAIETAVNQVFQSYRKLSESDEVLVQPMVSDVALSGVVMTRDLDTGGPYYVINYDDFSGRTDTVTGGQETKTILVYRLRLDSLYSKRLRKLIDCVQELEEVTSSEELDIEFCITNDETVYILQVRPLAARQRWLRISDDQIDTNIRNIRSKLVRRMKPQVRQAGQTTIFGEMPDWNPAEIIGNAPRPLALSLYKALITNKVWAKARADMGYRQVSAPLLVDFCGRPFVDVRLSLNSFLPADLNDNLAKKLINFQLKKLATHTEWHDKIEFEIAITCRDFDFERHRQPLQGAGFSNDEFEQFGAELSKLTHKAIDAGAVGVQQELKRTDLLLDAGSVGSSNVSRIGKLISNCRQFGTLPFSILARHGFIGISMLKSLIRRGVFKHDISNHLMASINTVAGDLVRAMYEVSVGVESKEHFLQRFGHLRPGTYDITSWRYDEKPDMYLGHKMLEMPKNPEIFKLTKKQVERIEALLSENGYALSAQGLIDYIVESIKSREQAKLVFTRTLSDALLAITEWGAHLGLDRDALSYLKIEEILGNYTETFYSDQIRKRIEGHHLTRAIRVPHLICTPDDIDVVRLPLGQPNFITNQKVTAGKMVMGAHGTDKIDGKIILIESADPGYDWIFTHKIVGLITKYGGANSHMAIRSAEFGLPAAIGCGEQLFKILEQSNIIELNCAAWKVSGH